MRSRGRSLVSLAVLLAASTAAPDTLGFPLPQGPRPVQTGTRWVVAERNRGSFGWEQRKFLAEALGERVWRGQAVRAFSDGEAITYVDASTYGVVARVRGGVVLETFDPPPSWDWPIAVGKSWEREFRYTDHEHGRTVASIRARYKVEGYGEVTVPGGTFKAFRIICETPEATVISWWSPEIGLTVRSVVERTTEHYLGRGTRELEVLLYETPWSRPIDAE